MQSIMGDVFLDMLLYIFTVSIGLAILFNRNASSGGLDFRYVPVGSADHYKLDRLILNIFGRAYPRAHFRVCSCNPGPF